jgi:hypothetical protein
MLVLRYGYLSKFDARLTTSFGIFFFPGDKLPTKNTWSGISLSQSRHQSFTTTTLQKSPSAKSIANLSDISDIKNMV